jgi:hypothetical protein
MEINWAGALGKMEYGAAWLQDNPNLEMSKDEKIR